MACSISARLDLFMPLRFFPSLLSLIILSKICLSMVFYISMEILGMCWRRDGSYKRVMARGWIFYQ